MKEADLENIKKYTTEAFALDPSIKDGIKGVCNDKFLELGDSVWKTDEKFFVDSVLP